MRYSGYVDGLPYLMLQVLLEPDATMLVGFGPFCKDQDFNCWKHLNVKDD